MRLAIAIVVTLALNGAMALAGEEQLRVRPDPLYRGQELIERPDGSRVGVVRPDPFYPDQELIDRDDGSRVGRVRPDPFYPGDDLVDTESSDLD